MYGVAQSRTRLLGRRTLRPQAAKQVLSMVADRGNLWWPIGETRSGRPTPDTRCMSASTRCMSASTRCMSASTRCMSASTQGSLYWGGGGGGGAGGGGGGGGGWGGEDSPPNTPASPPKFLTINSVKVVSGTAACSYTCVLCTVSCYAA